MNKTQIQVVVNISILLMIFFVNTSNGNSNPKEKRSSDNSYKNFVLSTGNESKLHNNNNTKVVSLVELPSVEELLPNAIVSRGNNSRLQAIFRKASKGKKIVIGVLGGSITQGAKCTVPEERYPNVVLHWWKNTFPNTEFELVNAGIGATGSDYGAMRAKRDLLSKSPDFVVMDYAVNDRDTKEYAESYEGVVRQILNSSQKPALFLLFMMKSDGTNAQDWEAKIGNHYQLPMKLPMISYRDALFPEITKGKLKWEDLSPDDVHPNNAGHTLTGLLINGLLEEHYASFLSDKRSDKKPAIPSPMLSNDFEYTQLFDGKELEPSLNKGWLMFDSKSKFTGWESSAPGSILEFKISGSQLFLSCYKINGPLGKASVRVDDGTPVIIDAWYDQTWGGYRYMVPIASGLNPGKHTVRIELLQDKNEQSTGNTFRVLALGATGIKK